MSEHAADADGTAVPLLHGELTIYQVADLAPALLPVAAQGEDWQLNLDEVTELDGAGLQLLLRLQRETEQAGARMTLVATDGPAHSVLTLLDLLPRDTVEAG